MSWIYLGLGALIVTALFGELIVFVVREARARQKAEDDASLARRNAELSKKQSEIIAEHRDPERVSDRFRDGTF